MNAPVKDRGILSATAEKLRHLTSMNGNSIIDTAERADTERQGSYAHFTGGRLDIMMPKVDGITVLRRIRAQGNAIPVLILTAKSEIDDRVTGLDAGADDYLTKPFSSRELLARIRAITRRQGESVADTLLSFGNVTLDRSVYDLTGPSGRVRLGNKEYQMMEMLMMNPGQLISTDRFMDRIWVYDSDAEINVVWVYLSNLRKKLLSVGASVQIRAARGLGYSLEEKK